MHLEEIISSCNQAISLHMSERSRPSLESVYAAPVWRTSLKRPSDLSPALLSHVCDCLDCLFAVMDPTTSLAESGCEKFKDLLGEDGLLPIDSSSSPLAFAHVSDEMIEEYCFGRLSEPDKRGLEGHVAMCIDCLERVESQREFIREMKTVLRKMAVPVITAQPLQTEVKRNETARREEVNSPGLAMAAGV
jgi:hypothetical protein